MAVAGLVVPISGPAIGTWNALPFGTLNDDGYELRCTLQGQEVNETDAYGMTLVEAIYRGMNWRCLLRSLEWQKTGGLSVLQAFGQTGAVGTLTPQLVNIGDRWTKYGQSMVLTAILGNPPTQIGGTGGSPQTLTALSANFAPNSQTAFNITSKVRELPLELTLMPYASGSPAVNVPFTAV